jgi:hypothetical protein
MAIMVGPHMIPREVGTLVHRGQCQNSQFMVRYLTAAQGPWAMNSHANDYRTPLSMTNLLTTLMTDTTMSLTLS